MKITKKLDSADFSWDFMCVNFYFGNHYFDYIQALIAQFNQILKKIYIRKITSHKGVVYALFLVRLSPRP